MNTETCGRCKAAITCNANDISNCDCNKVTLSKATKAHLSKTRFKCLCNDCLNHFNALTEASQNLQFPTNRTEMIEGVHYYIENGYFVFTEKYYLLRGYCCQNGCRHCVYGFKK